METFTAVATRTAHAMYPLWVVGVRFQMQHQRTHNSCQILSLWPHSRPCDLLAHAALGTVLRGPKCTLSADATCASILRTPITSARCAPGLSLERVHDLTSAQRFLCCTVLSIAATSLSPTTTPTTSSSCAIGVFLASCPLSFTLCVRAFLNATAATRHCHPSVAPLCNTHSHVRTLFLEAQARINDWRVHYVPPR